MNFKHWCMRQFRTSDAMNATHLFLDNGKIHVPTEELPKFLQQYYKAIQHGEHCCLVEKLGKNCHMRFFLDIDLKESNGCKYEDVLYEIFQCANEIVGILGDIYTCTERKGIHIIYNKSVTYNEAKLLVKEIKSKCNSAYSRCIDTSVYNTGLRMIGACKNTTDTRCYMPFDNEFTFENFKRSIVRIKTIEADNDIVIYKSCTEVESFLRKTYNIPELEIKTMKRIGDYISCTTNSKYCQNVQREHKNAKTYYVFDLQKRTSYQKCFCTCINENVFNSCKYYKSKSVGVPYIIISHLQNK